MGFFDDEKNQKEIEDSVKKQLSIYKPGVYNVKLLEVKKVVSKKGGLFLKFVFGDRNHKPVQHFFGWQGNFKKEELMTLGIWTELGFGKKVKDLVNSPLNDEEEVEQVCSAYQEFIGKEVQVALGVRELLFCKEDDKTGKFILVKSGENYIHLLSSTTSSLHISDISKLTKELSPDDNAKYSSFLLKQEQEKQEQEQQELQEQQEEANAELPTDDVSEDDKPPF